MKIYFETILNTRKAIVALISDLSEAQLNEIPKNFNNNIAWNLGHVMVSQELLCYHLSGLKCNIKYDVIDKFKKGSKPTEEISMNEITSMKALLIDLAYKLEADYNKGIFINYNNYKTSLDVELKSIEDAIAFNLFHEGIHLGAIMQMVKLV
ncbi:MAG TPA: DinB family protein [Flavobacteriaceae bacterium]|nr:DinB family protein [Flavobacteriaceae bacterium]